MSVALLEDVLSQNWTQFLGGSLGGARVTNWNTQLLRNISHDYNLIIYDVGPSLGALNRSILIGVDYFISPMGCDIFRQYRKSHPVPVAWSADHF